MARHSKWHNIQKRKGAVDAKKAVVFSKLAKAISAASRGGGDPAFNFQLRMAVDAAKAVNMSKDNIDRAIKRGTGESGDAVIEEVVYEGFGPGGIALLVRCLTDNRARTVADLKYLASKNGGSLGGSGSVMWLFDKKAVITVADVSLIKDRDAFELAVIDAGAQDIQDNEGALQIVGEVANLKKIVEAVEGLGVKVDGADIEYLAKDPVAVADPAVVSALDALVEVLDEYDDVDAVFTNSL
jgi:YebC/PmpR family DNA-binding regulatory protein